MCEMSRRLGTGHTRYGRQMLKRQTIL